LELNPEGHSSLAANPARSIWILPETLQLMADSGDAEIVAEILDIFKMDTAQRLQVLREALSRTDRVRVQQQAHSIKGSAVQVGANSLAALCQQIELDAGTQPCGELASLVGQAEADFESLCRLPEMRLG
jgi:HPt (histidine-containing phosphotransfer) domain-containing protein